jgi:hypothetical protein
MRAHYTDERLVELLAHAQSGKLSFSSCCCFIGIPTADHALRGYDDHYGAHYHFSEVLSGAAEAERAFHLLSHDRVNDIDRDAKRRRKIIPMIRAEIKRRDTVRASQRVEVEATA